MYHRREEIPINSQDSSDFFSFILLIDLDMTFPITYRISHKRQYLKYMVKFDQKTCVAWPLYVCYFKNVVTFCDLALILSVLITVSLKVGTFNIHLRIVWPQVSLFQIKQQPPATEVWTCHKCRYFNLRPDGRGVENPLWFTRLAENDVSWHTLSNILFCIRCGNFRPRSCKVRSPGHAKWPHLIKRLNVRQIYTN